MTKRIVLAYSGGLDTSVAIGWIASRDRRRGHRRGGRRRTGRRGPGDHPAAGAGLRRRRGLWSTRRTSSPSDYCLPALKANALYQGPLPAGLGALPPGDRQAPGHGRPRVRRRHGRPRLHRQGQRPGPLRGRHPEPGARTSRCIAPVRDRGMTRDKAIAFAEEQGPADRPTKKKPYSIDQNLWGRAVETGFLEDLWNAPTEDVYAYTADPAVRRRAGRGRHHLRGTACRSRSTAAAVTRLAGDRASSTAGRRPGRRAGSTWSRTAWSASRAARSTRRPARSR